MSYSRRDFLRQGLSLTAGAIALPMLSNAQETGAASATPSQSSGPRPTVIHVGGVDTDAKIAQGVRRAVDELGGMGRFVQSGNTVVIKPNVGFPNPPEDATTTHPLAVRTAAELCLEAGAARVIIMDYPVRSPRLCFERSTMINVADGLDDTEVVVLTGGSAWMEREIPGHVQVPSVEVPRVLENTDVVISMPIAKCHGGAGLSFSMKNFMGMIRDRGAFHRRYDLHQAVVDLSRTLSPDLVITDATRALVTGGPGGPGRVERPNAILAGTAQVSVDAYTVGLARWYNRDFTANQVRHLRLASEQGLGEIDVNRMEIRRVSV